ncbi:hypothetical protein F4677DRAFT_447734 [Hypoxylon crocopeplum]|nr:hypothetical protein F4677DRAFT_447734 [Hypoxylon crocopeplum]
MASPESSGPSPARRRPGKSVAETRRARLRKLPTPMAKQYRRVETTGNRAKGNAVQVSGGIHDRKHNQSEYTFKAKNMVFRNLIPDISTRQPLSDHTALSVVNQARSLQLTAAMSTTDDSIIDSEEEDRLQYQSNGLRVERPAGNIQSTFKADAPFSESPPSIALDKLDSTKLRAASGEMTAHQLQDDRSSMGDDTGANIIMESLDTIKRNQRASISTIQSIRKWPSSRRKDANGIIRSLRTLQALASTPNKEELLMFKPAMEARGLVTKILDPLRSARDISEAIKNIAKQIHKMILESQRSKENDRSTIIDPQLLDCRDQIKQIRRGLNDFQFEFNQAYCSDRSDVVSPLAQEEPVSLVDLETSRNASAILCRELCQICNRHQTHQIYFNLELDNQVCETHYNLSFRVAFQGTDHNRESLVWMKADMRIDKKSSPAVPQASPRTQPCGGASFCPGTLTNNHKFEFSIGSSTFLHEVAPISERSELTRLSDWITEGIYRDRLSRIRLARLIAEAVLKLNPTLWDSTLLKSHRVMVIAPSTREAAIQSHIHITLSQQEHNQHCDSENSTYLRMVLFNLGVTLLELACLKYIPRPACEYGRIDRYSPEIMNITELCRAGDLDKMGEKYAGVVRFCLFGDHEGNVYDLEVQKHFYWKVVRDLEIEESKEIANIYVELDEIRQGYRTTAT